MKIDRSTIERVLGLIKERKEKEMSRRKGPHGKIASIIMGISMIALIFGSVGLFLYKVGKKEGWREEQRNLLVNHRIAVKVAYVNGETETIKKKLQTNALEGFKIKMETEGKSQRGACLSLFSSRGGTAKEKIVCDIRSFELISHVSDTIRPQREEVK